MTKYILAIGLALLITVLTFSGLAGASEDVAVYTIADPTGDWGYPSPYGHYARGPGYVRMSFIFDTLVWKDDKGYVPALAESWEKEDDDVFVFHLRNDATWHDGEMFTADDVVFTLDYIKDHPYQWVDSGIVDRAETVDDETVRVYLVEPYAPFLDQVAGTLPILPEHVYKDVTDPVSFKDEAALTGTGPYTLENYDKVQGTYRYLAYEDYYGGAPRVKEIRFVKVPEQTAPSSLGRGDVDASSIPPDVADSLKDDGFTIVNVPSHWWSYMLMINHQTEPFSDPNFRQALAYAIDRQKLVDVAARGQGLKGSPGLIPQDNSWYNPGIEQYAHDVGKAKLFLSQAGYSGEEVELLVKGETTDERIGQLIKEDLEEAGIKVNMRTMDSKTLDNKIKDWDFDLALSGHGGLIGDPNFLARNTIDMKSFNSARYDGDPELTQVLEEQVVETDDDERSDLIDRAQVLYARDMPALSLYYPDWFWAHDGGVDLFYTKNGIALGVPIPLNKLAFV